MSKVHGLSTLGRPDGGPSPEPGTDEVAQIRRALELAEQRLDALSMIDPLTETLNRRGVESALWTELARDRRSGSNLSGILLWCDQLSGISTSLGHGVADVIVRAIANRIKACLRPSDSVAHIDVDKFLVLLPDTRIAEARRVAEKLRLAVRRLPLAMVPDPVIVDIRTSVVHPRKATCSIQELLEQAHFRPAAEGVHAQGLHAESLLAEGVHAEGVHAEGLHADGGTSPEGLLQMIDEGRFYAVSQPIMALEGDTVFGHELLTRGPSGPMAAPVDLFQRALDLNMLTTVDMACLKTAVETTTELGPPERFHVNLFPSTILSVPTDRLIERLGHRPGAAFCVEISEQQFIGDPASLRPHVVALRRSGIQVAIDDVGFGRSCLESLIVLEPDIVKIDRGYVGGAAGDPHRRRLLERLIEVVRTLGAEIVAEGIESRADLSLLRDLGVGYGQGWLWGKPGAGYFRRDKAS